MSSLIGPSDVNAILQSLRAVVESGSVFEIRILNTSRGTVSGYFDDPDKAARAILPYDGKYTIYVTLNPVNQALLARAANRLVEYAKHTTSDADTLRPRYLLIDCDPCRPAGISATDAEKAAAIGRTHAIRDFLTRQLGWPLPIVADSGNGGHLLYPIDQPNDDAARSLIESCLKALSLRFTDDAVSVDESVHNAARILKVYSSVACKGDSTPDRPHRRARILEMPAEIVWVTREQLEQLAATLPVVDDCADRANGRQMKAAGEPFDVEQRLSSWGVTILRTKPYLGGTAYILAACPFNADHTNGSAVVIKNAAGRLGFRCLHNSCRDFDWSTLRAKFEPGYQARVHTLSAGSDAEATSGVEWEPPVPFSTADLPAFPLEALPSPIGHYVAEIAKSTQVPIDLPAMTSLSVIGTAAARFCEVRVGDTHTEVLVVWSATAMDSGSRKTAAMELVVSPLREAERELATAAKPGIIAATEKRAVEEKRLARLRDQAAKAKDEIERDDLVREIEELSGGLTEVPIQPRLLADDVTQEKLAGLLAGHDGCIGIFSAEGGIFETLAGRYSGQSAKVNLDLFLKGHCGEEVRVDRVGRSSEFIRRAMISMGLAVQPSVLESLSNTPAFRGRGLLARFLYSVPQSLVGTRKYQNRGRSERAREDYHRAIRTLLSYAPPVDADRIGGLRHELRITGPALTAWSDYANEIEFRQKEGRDLSGITDFASKLAGAVARIAAGFHLVEHAGVAAPWHIPVSEESVLAAWAIGEYLIPHALAAFGQMGADSGHSLAKRLLSWIRELGVSQFSLRDCHQAHRLHNRQEIERALSELVDRVYLRPAKPDESGGRGRPRGPLFDINPLTQKSQNTQN